MPAEAIRIYDTTLRDGLRNSGVTIELEDKVRLVRQLALLGVRDIEVGFGGPTQVDTMRRLADVDPEPVLYGLSRVNRRDLDRVLTALSAARRHGVNIFSPVSESFLGYSSKSPEQALTESVRAVSHARAHTDHIVFSAQDAPRADRAFLTDILAAAIDAGATAISVADTTSQALPHEFGPFVGGLRDTVPGGKSVIWSVHCHNDIGLAAANCAAALEHGARQVECTLGGIGERNGNTSMQTIAWLLDKRADAFPDLACNLNLEGFAATEALLSDISRSTDSSGSDVVELLRRSGGQTM